LIATYEASYQVQWDSLSERYRAGMLRGIVSFELRVNRLEGKYKLSQNRSHGEQQRISAALNASDDPAAQAIGHAMRGAS
jgi:transcriptional regulator